MIAVDTNVLVYAHRKEMPLHAQALARLVALAEGDVPWAIPVFCLGEFARVVTHRRVFDRPHTAEEVRAAVDRLTGSPSLAVLRPGGRYLSLFLAAIVEARATGNLVYDAQIAALCREAGVSALLTEDRDFGRFQGFRTERL